MRFFVGLHQPSDSKHFECCFVSVVRLRRRKSNFKVNDWIMDSGPDLRLHGFGLKTTALANATIRDSFETADSMAWSFAARREGRNANDWTEAEAFHKVVGKPRMYQSHLIELLINDAVAP